MISGLKEALTVGIKNGADKASLTDGFLKNDLIKIIMAKKHILIVPGDGIGQEVTEVGKKVLEKIAAKFGHDFTYDEALIGHNQPYSI